IWMTRRVTITPPIAPTVMLAREQDASPVEPGPVEEFRRWLLGCFGVGRGAPGAGAARRRCRRRGPRRAPRSVLVCPGLRVVVVPLRQIGEGVSAPTVVERVGDELSQRSQPSAVPDLGSLTRTGPSRDTSGTPGHGYRCLQVGGNTPVIHHPRAVGGVS